MAGLYAKHSNMFEFDMWADNLIGDDSLQTKRTSGSKQVCSKESAASGLRRLFSLVPEKIITENYNCFP